MNGSSTTRTVFRARISSRILKPWGRSAPTSTEVRRTAKNPVIGSVQFRSRLGNMARVAMVDALETSLRVSPLRPPSLPPGTRRDATTTSAPVVSPVARSTGIISGGCCRSPSITRHQSLVEAARPSATAPLSPPTGSVRWMSRTGSAAPSATRRTSWGVSSFESSTNSTSVVDGSTDAVMRRTSSATFGDSLNVGTMIVAVSLIRRSSWHVNRGRIQDGGCLRNGEPSLRRPHARMSLGHVGTATDCTPSVVAEQSVTHVWFG